MALGVGLYGASRISRAAPPVDRQGLWIDTVKHGGMSREVHGVGELVPNDDASRWVAAELDGRIDRKLVEEGTRVTADTIVLQLSNPDVEQAAVAAALALDAAEAAYESLNASLQNELLALQSAAAAIESDRAQAAIQAEVDTRLSSEGLLADITSRQSTVRAEALATRARLEQNRIATTERSLSSRLPHRGQRSTAGARSRSSSAATLPR